MSKSEALASLARQVVERVQDDALTPVTLSVEHAADLLEALAERNRVIEQARVALRHGIKTINHLGGAVECMPLHEALRAIEEVRK